MLNTIQSLIAQIEQLQEQLADLRGEVRETLADGLEEGMTHEDIREVQQLLATDPDIYPRGIVSGYFGPLTRDALIRFQTKHDLSTSGRLDSETRELLEEYLDERFNGNIPPGLLRAPGIQKKVHDRICSNRGHGRSMFGLFCHNFNNEDDDRDDEDEHELEVEVEEHDGRTHVHVEYRNGREESFYIRADIDDKDEVIEDIADKTGLDEDDIEDVIEFKDHDEDDEDDHDGFEDVSVEVDGNDTIISFTYDGDDYEVGVDSTDEDDILEEIADELDMDVDDLDSDFVDDVLDELEEELEDENDGIEVRVEYKNDEVTVEFTFEGDDYEVEVDSTDRDDIFDAIADELDIDIEDLDDELLDLVDEALDGAGL
jgi:hypothetical protein